MTGDFGEGDYCDYCDCDCCYLGKVKSILRLGLEFDKNQAPRSESVQLEVKVKFQLEEGEGLNSSQEDKIGDLKTNHLAPRQTKIRRHTVQEQRVKKEDPWGIG